MESGLDARWVVPFVAESRAEMGRRAAEDIAVHLRYLLARQGGVRMIFAAAPSQAEMLEGLVGAAGIDWSRVTAFHMDEYLGLREDAPQRFGLWLKERLFDRAPFGAVHRMDPEGDPVGVGYAARLREGPIDLVCCGIGTNGHLAFNDPPADFDDVEDVKVVRLDAMCRQQQVDDGCFATIDAVPTHALTLTIPRLMRAGRIFCCVPGRLKREAVRRTLEGPIDVECPASVLRRHGACGIYLDRDSAAALRSDG